jgi:hypothetical protein
MPTAKPSAYKKIIFFSNFFLFLFWKNENSNFKNLYADGFAVGVACYAEGRATPTAMLSMPRDLNADAIRRGQLAVGVCVHSCSDASFSLLLQTSHTLVMDNHATISEPRRLHPKAIGTRRSSKIR